MRYTILIALLFLTPLLWSNGALSVDKLAANKPQHSPGPELYGGQCSSILANRAHEFKGPQPKKALAQNRSLSPNDAFFAVPKALKKALRQGQPRDNCEIMIAALSP